MLTMFLLYQLEGADGPNKKFYIIAGITAGSISAFYIFFP